MLDVALVFSASAWFWRIDHRALSLEPLIREGAAWGVITSPKNTLQAPCEHRDLCLQNPVVNARLLLGRFVGQGLTQYTENNTLSMLELS